MRHCRHLLLLLPSRWHRTTPVSAQATRLAGRGPCRATGGVSGLGRPKRVTQRNEGLSRFGRRQGAMCLDMRVVPVVSRDGPACRSLHTARLPQGGPARLRRSTGLGGTAPAPDAAGACVRLQYQFRISNTPRRQTRPERRWGPLLLGPARLSEADECRSASGASGRVDACSPRRFCACSPRRFCACSPRRFCACSPRRGRVSAESRPRRSASLGGPRAPQAESQVPRSRRGPPASQPSARHSWSPSWPRSRAVYASLARQAAKAE